jgi:hypothetical protein
VTPVDDIKNILPPWLMECIQEKNTPAEATGGSLARYAKRIRSKVSENLTAFAAENLMIINISINQMVLPVNRLMLKKEISVVITKRTLHL